MCSCPKCLSHTLAQSDTMARLITLNWNITHAPKEISNGFSILRLEHESITSFVLANAFDPCKGHVKATVPWVVEGNYSSVLFGDSGNYSPMYEILGGLK